MNTIFHDWTKAVACAIVIAVAPAVSSSDGIFASDASGNLVAALSTNATAPVILAQPVSQVRDPGRQRRLWRYRSRRRTARFPMALQ